LSKEASKERMGREPLRQLPVKWSSSIVCTADVDWFASSKWGIELGRGRTVLDMHLNGRSIGRFAHP
jgi:hypothetical protein